MPSILIVEDDRVMAVSLRDGLEYHGYTVVVAKDGAEGLRLATHRAFDLIVLDVMLPSMSGIDVCRRIRSEENTVPIIMLTARGQEMDKVLGLRSGADDYVTKPFGFMELLARVEAALRRAQGGHSTDNYAFGDVEIDFKMMRATKGRTPVELSPLEFKIVKFLVERRHQVVTRDQMLDAVWGMRSSSLTRTVDTHIAKLRKKLEDSPDEPVFIVTIYGSGYKFLG